jgi:hypothetical protein
MPLQKQHSIRTGLLTSKLESNLRKKPMMCDIWSIALYSTKNWTLRKVEEKNLESLECGAGKGWRSAGSIGLETRKNYIEPKRKEMSSIQ